MLCGHRHIASGTAALRDRPRRGPLNRLPESRVPPFPPGVAARPSRFFSTLPRLPSSPDRPSPDLRGKRPSVLAVTSILAGFACRGSTRRAETSPMRRYPWLTFSGRGGSRCMEQISATRRARHNARGTYLYDYFWSDQSRVSPAEARFFAFVCGNASSRPAARCAPEGSCTRLPCSTGTGTDSWASWIRLTLRSFLCPAPVLSFPAAVARHPCRIRFPPRSGGRNQRRLNAVGEKFLAEYSRSVELLPAFSAGSPSPSGSSGTPSCRWPRVS